MLKEGISGYKYIAVYWSGFEMFGGDASYMGSELCSLADWQSGKVIVMRGRRYLTDSDVKRK